MRAVKTSLRPLVPQERGLEWENAQTMWEIVTQEL